MGIFYKSLRVGKNGLTFNLLKFRTMRTDGGTPTASLDDERLTTVGKFLRRTKLDELPTLLNVLKGDISLVGPRPDVPSEIQSLDRETRESVLSVKPGLISPATLWNIDEDKVLAGEKDPHAVYCARIKPTKYALNVWYVNNKSLWFDARVLCSAFLRLVGIKKDLFNVLPSWLDYDNGAESEER